MKQVLVIGSTVADVIIRIDHLPHTGEDIHVLGHSMSLGGCAYNTFSMIRHFGVPCTLFSPIGQGSFGHFVREALKETGVGTPIPAPQEENGCCYCFVEASGERTFICYRGAEYRFRPEWFDIPDPGSIESVYICGLEIEEPTGTHIVSYLERHREYRLFFAPGPRIMVLSREILDRIFSLHPILHLNETEALEFTRESSVEAAARTLRESTGGSVIVTLGENGAYCLSDEGAFHAAGVRANVVDTIGAGDAHAGAVLARLMQGAALKEAVTDANIAAAAVVSVTGARLSDAAFEALKPAIGGIRHDIKGQATARVIYRD